MCVCVCVCVCFGIYEHDIFLLLRDLPFSCFAYFYYLVICSILFHYIHAFLWLLCTPLIILDHLYVSWVKLSSFLYPLSIMTKMERNCNVVSFFKILHVRGRNTFLCKGELCFILLGGVLTSFFVYTGLVTMFIYIMHIFDIYIYMMMYVFFTYHCMCWFFSLFIHMFLMLICNLLFLFHTKMP